MGCHTWFYKKIDVDFETMRNFVLKEYNESANTYQKWILDPTDKDYLSLLEAYPDWTIDKISDWKDAIERRITMIKKGLCKEATINKYCEFSKGISRHIKGKGIFIECGYHDVFRKYGYPDDVLLSYEETLYYIDYPPNECHLYEGSLERLKEFWDKYPDGMIDFG